MAFSSSCERPIPGVFKPTAIMLALLVLVLFSGRSRRAGATD